MGLTGTFNISNLEVAGPRRVGPVLAGTFRVGGPIIISYRVDPSTGILPVVPPKGAVGRVVARVWSKTTP